MKVEKIMRDVEEMYEKVEEDEGVKLKIGEIDDVEMKIKREMVGKKV